MILPEWKKALILISGLFEILIFSGTILGWPSLKLMLKTERIYAYKCDNSSPIIFPENSNWNASRIQLDTRQNSTKISPFLASALTTTERPLSVTINGTEFEVTTSIVPTVRPSNLSSNSETNNNNEVEDDDQEPEESKNVKSPLLSQVSLKLDLTVSAVGNRTLQNNGQPIKSIVIPFEANQSLDPNTIYELVNSGSGVKLTSEQLSPLNNPTNQSSIRLPVSSSSSSSSSLSATQLLRNRNATNSRQPTVSSSSFLGEIRLFPRFINPNDGRNVSTLEDLLHIYLSENVPMNEHRDDVCRGQEDTLDLAYAIGTFCMGAAAFIWGFLLEKWGLRIVRLIISSMIAFGAFLMCFITPGQDWILFPALLIMALGGVPIRIVNMQFSNLYPAKRSTIIAVYSGAFSASSIIYVMIEYVYRELSLTFFSANMILVALSVLMIPFTLFILPKDRIHEQHKSLKNDAKEKTIEVYDQNGNRRSELQIDSKPHFLSQNITLQNYREVKSPNAGRKGEHPSILPTAPQEGGFDNEAYVNDEEQNNNNNNYIKQLPVPVDEKMAVSQIKTESPPLGISLYSIPYNLHQLWFSWMITYMLLYVGALNPWAQRVTPDPAKQAGFFKLFGSVQVLALLISPLAGLLMDYKIARANQVIDPLKRKIKRVQSGFWSLFITTICLLLCVIFQFFDRQEFVYLSIIFVTIYRSFLLAVGSAFLRVRFHGEHFNRLLGIMSSVSAFTSLIQIALLRWNFLYTNIVSLIFAIIVMSNPLYLLITPLQKYFIRKEDEQIKKYS